MSNEQAGAVASLIPNEIRGSLRNERPLKARVLEGNPDNEGADEIFGVKSWREVDVALLLASPAALWFLNDSALDYFLPALVCAIVSSKTRDRAQAQHMFDLLEARVERLTDATDWRPSSVSIDLIEFARTQMANDVQ